MRLSQTEVLLIALAASAAVGLLFKKLKVPGGVLVGAVIGAAVVTIVFKGGRMPLGIKLTAQISAGAYIGCSIARDELKELRKVTKPAIVMLLSLFLVNIGCGVALWLIGYTDLLTALMCATPGGMSDIPLIAADMGCDISKILVIHFFRLLAGLGLFPAIIMRYEKMVGDGTHYEESEIQTTGKQDKTPYWKILVVFAFCTVLGLGARALGVPSGAVMFSILGALLLKVLGFQVKLPMWIKRCAQILSGAFIGCQADFSGFTHIGIAVAAVAISIGFYLANCFAAGTFMSRKYRIPLRESMLMLTPAGAADMALVSADMGITSPRLILLQFFRLIVVTAFFPQICYSICQLILSIAS